jgi:hypothetical protein
MVCTDVFSTLGRSTAAQLGVPDLPIVSVPHPIGHLTPPEIREVGEQAVGAVVDAMLGAVASATAADATSPPQPTVARAPKIKVPADAAELFDDFWRRGWSEGLPVIPPTLERIERAVAYLGRDPAEVLGTVAPRQGLATVEAVVANAVMAGCSDEVLPVVLAAVEGVCRPRHNLSAVQATTGSVTPMIVVFGPGASRLGITGGVGCLGPGFRENATIGRALRLVLWNVGGGRPGDLDRATHGQPGKFTLCIAENQAENPWTPWHQDKGFDAEETAVLVTGVMGTEDLIDYSSQNADDLLTMLGSCGRTLAANHMLYGGWSTFLLAPEHAQLLADAGYTRADVARLLAERGSVPFSAFPTTSREVLRRKRPRLFGPAGQAPDLVPAFDSADHLQVIVSGGPGPHSVFCPSYGDLTDPQWVPVRWPTTGGGPR